MWTHQLLLQLLGDRAGEPSSPYTRLPQATNMRVAIRRGLRVGQLAGTPVEDLGVTPTVQHALTRADILNGNVDLLERAGQILAGMLVRRLTVTITRTGTTSASVAVQAGPVQAGAVVVAEGYERGVLVAARRVAV